MLEVFFATLPFYVIGLVGGAFAAKPIGAALISGHTTAVTSSLIWQMVWGGLGAILALAILAALRLAFFSAAKLFAADGDWGTVRETETIEEADDEVAELGKAVTPTTTTTNDDAEAKA